MNLLDYILINTTCFFLKIRRFIRLLCFTYCSFRYLTPGLFHMVFLVLPWIVCIDPTNFFERAACWSAFIKFSTLNCFDTLSLLIHRTHMTSISTPRTRTATFNCQVYKKNIACTSDWNLLSVVYAACREAASRSVSPHQCLYIFQSLYMWYKVRHFK